MSSKSHNIVPSTARFFIILWMVTISALCTYAHNFTIVLDPGHGGKDFGAVGTTTREKDINLGVAQKLGELIKNEMKDVKLVYTRNTDKFVTLQGRADIANKAGGDLFVSIHTNSVDAKSPRRTKVNGASVYTLGLKRSDENLNVAKRENAVMMLENDYTTTYRGFDPNSTESYIMFELSCDIHMDHSIKAANAIQSELTSTAGRADHGVRQAVFWVLVQTSMPAVLVELDFICNPAVEKFLGSKSGQDKLAQAIFNGIKAYKRAYDKENKAIKKSGVDTKTTQSSGKPAKNDKGSPKSDGKSSSKGNESKANNEDSPIIYKIQFMTLQNKIPENSSKFKGLTPNEHYKDKGMVKYTYGATPSMTEANKLLRKVREKFPDAFIIKTRDNKRIN